MPQEDMRQSYRTDVIRGVIYFTLVFGVGFVLGTVRVIWLAPLIGERYAEFIEAPMMLAAICIFARYAIYRFPADRDAGYIFSGALALLILLLVEFSVVLTLRGLSITQYFNERDPVAGTIYVVMLSVFTFMPWFLGRKRVDM
jgi:hypothetical protein